MKSQNLNRFLIVVLSLTTLCASCSSQNHGAASSYATVGRDPTRDTDQARAQDDRAVEQIEKHQWDQAEQLLKSALELDVTFGPAHNNLGKVYFAQSKLYLAAWEFQYAAKLMPNQPEPRNNLGLVLEQAGKLDDAAKSYDAALGLEPDNVELLGNAVRCRVRRGDKDEQTTELLQKVVMRETRPQWLQWAKEQLALRGKPDTN